MVAEIAPPVCPASLTAEEVYAEVRRLYHALRTASHDEQSVLIAQINVLSGHYKALTRPPARIRKDR